jgi:hypothetical protein
VSLADQNPGFQLDGLAETGCFQIFHEKEPGFGDHVAAHTYIRPFRGALVVKPLPPRELPTGVYMAKSVEGTSKKDAEILAAAINSYWAERGFDAGAKSVPIFGRGGQIISYGTTSDLRLAPKVPLIE